MSTEQQKEQKENSDNQVPDSGTSSVEEQIQEAYAKLPKAGQLVYNKTMVYALKGLYDEAIKSYVEDMNQLKKVVGFDNTKKLQTRASDIKQFQLCVLELIQEAGFN
ncbi:hypothetical protein SLS62_002732 [Diatrype stigma]|uniref:Uncharacterized protein n=1 Tax=Diatrype stigma TaxID=117547 RepID=A0AAN9UXY0_9PEZI